MERSRNRRLPALAAGTALLVLIATAALAGTGTAAPQAPPQNQSLPTISGTPQEGATLTANPGNWTGNPTFTYSWRRCDRNGDACSAISGANERTYRLRGVDVGRTLRVRVTARNNDGTTNATSVPSAVITAAPPAARGCDVAAPLQVGNLTAPERLNISQGSVTPSIIRRTSTTITLRFQVTCKGKPVQGALVYATAVPFNQYTIPAEQATGADGFAQMTMTQLAGFPAARNQQLLVVFARARKPGESVLGGISTRRLVSFPVDLRS